MCRPCEINGTLDHLEDNPEKKKEEAPIFVPFEELMKGSTPSTLIEEIHKEFLNSNILDLNGGIYIPPGEEENFL